MVTVAASCHLVCGAGCSGVGTLPEGPTGTEQATSSGVSLSWLPLTVSSLRCQQTLVPEPGNVEHTHIPADSRDRGPLCTWSEGERRAFQQGQRITRKAVVIPPWDSSKL